MAALASWYYHCWPQHIVYINAPTWNQCLGLTFKQTKRFQLELGLPGEILETGLIRDPERVRQTDHFIKAVNAQSGEGFQGEHSAPILIILDEAVGVLPHIWEAARGLMTTKDARMVAVFNPTDEATHAGEFTKRAGVHVITISALDHPNIQAELRGEEQPFPGACDLLWLTEMIEDECEEADNPADTDAFPYWSTDVLRAVLAGRPVLPDDPTWVEHPIPRKDGVERGTPSRCFYRPTAYFQGRVLGIFPTQADEQVIPRGWLERLKEHADAEEKRPEIGCDVARYGSDRSTILIRRGPRVLWLREIRQMDTVFVTQALRDAAEEAATRCSLPDSPEGKPAAKTVPIKIDVSGGLGAGPYDTLKAEGYRAIPVNAASRAADPEMFKNRRSEMWFEMRERARTQDLDLSLLPKHQREALIRELSAPKYAVKLGKKVVEEKDEMKKRLGHSPDLADACMIAFTNFGKWWEDADLLAWLKRQGERKREPVSPEAGQGAGGTNLMQALKKPG